jgi:hypothetical protein
LISRYYYLQGIKQILPPRENNASFITLKEFSVPLDNNFLKVCCALRFECGHTVVLLTECGLTFRQGNSLSFSFGLGGLADSLLLGIATTLFSHDTTQAAFLTGGGLVEILK